MRTIHTTLLMSAASVLALSFASAATAADVDAVSALARTVWQATYPALISQAQIDAMLADRYAPERIREQLDDPRQAWWGARQGDALSGALWLARVDAETLARSQQAAGNW